MAFGRDLDYYDKILVAIGASLGGGALAGLVLPGPPEAGLLGGAVIASAFVYAAVFRNPPLPETTTRAKAAALIWHVFVFVLVLATVR